MLAQSPNKEWILEQAKKEAWHRGQQEKAILSDAQMRIHKKFSENNNPTFVVECSRQLGKTFWACFIADKFAREHPNCQIRLGTAFHVDIEPIVIPNFKNVLESCPDELRPRYARGSYWYPNGSRVMLVGLDKNPNKLRGSRVKLVIIEEAGFVDSDNLKYILDSVIAAAQLREPDARTILISTPPEEGQDHTFCEIADQMALEDSYIKLTIDESGLPESAIRLLETKLGGRDTIAFRREALCERIVDKDRALIKEWEDKYIQEPPRDEFYVYYHRYVAMDLGRKDFTALVFGYYDFKRATLFIEDELTMDGPNWTTLTLKNDVLAKEKELWGETKPFRRISDNNNPHLIIDLSSIHDIHFQETSKESLEAMINEVRLLVGQGRIIVSPKCKRTIGSLRYGVWDKNRKAFAHSKVYGHYDHFAALVYLVRNLAQSSNPIPATHGFANHKSWMLPLKEQMKTPNARAIQGVFTRHKKPRIPNF